MNTSVPWSIRGVGEDTREAAQEAARRSGQSLGDWLDDVIAEQASLREVPGREASVRRDTSARTDHRAEMEAIAAQLARIAAVPAPAEARRALAETAASPVRSQSSEASDFDPKAAIRRAVAEIARRQADLDRAEAPSRAAAQPARVRDDLMSGTAPRDRPVEQGYGLGQPPRTRIDRPRDASTLRGPRLDLSSEVSQTFAKFTRDLHEAINATDVRPQVDDLGQQMRRMGRTVDGISAGLASGEAIARIGEQTREIRDLMAAAAERKPAMSAVEHQLSNLEARLGSLAGSPQELTPELSGTLADVRSLLAGFSSGAGFAALEQRLEELTHRIERGLDAGDPAHLIESLSRRVDEIHSSLRSQLADAAVDTRPLEGLVRGIAERIGQAREASSEFQQLESAMREIAARIDGASLHDDRGAVQAIEAQITRLADRLDRSESSLKALDGVEHSLGELFSQFEVTRQVAIDAAETAARTAARDTLRAALQSPSLVQRPAETSGALADQVARSIDDLRAMQDLSDRRNQSVLAEMQQTMDRLARQMVVLATKPAEGIYPAAAAAAAAAAASPRRVEPVVAERAAQDRPSPDRAPEERSLDAAPPRRARVRSADGRGTESRTAVRAADRLLRQAEERAAPVELDPADMLIEPGLGRGQPGRSETRFDDASKDDTGNPESSGGPMESAEPDDAGGAASFIAAARRAARAAQASAAVTASTKAADRRPASRSRNEPGPSTLQRAKDYLAGRRRPILLGVAALVLLVGALEVVKHSLDSPVSGRGGALETTQPDAGRSRVASRSDTAAEADRNESSAKTPMSQSPAASTAPQPQSRPPLPTFVGGLGRPPTVPVEAAGIGEGLRGLAAAGDPAAQYEVGLRFADGRGVARDPKQAMGWLEKAAAQGLAPAEYRLGSAYEKGVGTDRDPALAMAWYGKAADAGNIRAMHNLAVMAAEGAAGKPDYAKASSWFQKASAYGVRDSQFNLAILYARGLGLEQSLAQSYTWFAIAASEGDEDAGKKRDEVGQKLDAKTLSAAKAAAEAYRAATPNASVNEIQPPPGGWDAVAPRAPAAGQPAVGQPAAGQPGGAKVSRL